MQGCLTVRLPANTPAYFSTHPLMQSICRHLQEIESTACLCRRRRYPVRESFTAIRRQFLVFGYGGWRQWHHHIVVGTLHHVCSVLLQPAPVISIENNMSRNEIQSGSGSAKDLRHSTRRTIIGIHHRYHQEEELGHAKTMEINRLPKNRL